MNPRAMQGSREPMYKILNITERLKDKKRKEQAKLYRHKVETIQRIVQCASCNFKCTMCGYHLNTSDPSCPPALPPSDLNLCENCRAEFEDFLKMSRGEKTSGIFWHNDEWVKLWAAWMDFHQAIGEFRNSAEFKHLITEG